MTQVAHIWRESFLAALREMPIVRNACAAVGIDRATAYRARAADPTFAAAWNEALEEGVDRAEQEAYRRGVVGYEEPVLERGSLVYRHERVVAEDGTEVFRPVLDSNGQPVPLTVKKFSDHLLALILKGRRKSVYADRTEVTSPDGSMSPAVDDTARTARIAQLLMLAQKRQAQQPDDFDLA